jgi:cell division protein FtsI (penicillin-binding protein 3)
VIAAIVWVALIAGKLVNLQVFHHQEYRRKSENQASKLVEIPAPRGSIHDRLGRPLALSMPVDSVAVNPLKVPAPKIAAGILARVFGVDRAEWEARLTAAAKESRGFLWVKRNADPSEVQRLRDMKPPQEWIDFRRESLRAYPNGSLASHLVGGVDSEEKGNAGLEQSLDKELQGRPGQERLTRDVNQRGVGSQLQRPPLAGKDLTLTIDERVQHVAERELAKAVQDSHSRTGSVVAMNPVTGEILALASYPFFDAGRPAASEQDLQGRTNEAVSVPFEPGSVFKIITLSAALETTDVRPDTVINCGNGQFNLFGRVIHDAHPYSALPMSEVLAKSSNIGAIQIGLKVGAKNLLEYVRRFGFGQTTGLPLPAESQGKVRDLKNWGRTSIGSVSMGHEVSTTTVQLAQAVSVIANGGLLVKPRLILSRQRPGEKPELEPVTPPQRVLQPETAITMRQMMEGVVLHGTGTRARLRGYSAGGKTGSAQIFDPACACYTHLYNSSFAGFAPVANPAIVVVVSINGASVFGGIAATPVFREVATAALRVLNVPKDLPDAPPPREAKPAQFADLAIADLGSPVVALSKPGIPDRGAPLELWGPTVPNFSGKSMRSVLEESAELGLPVELMGSGIVRSQTPSAGNILPRGERVRIQFAR